MEIDCIICFDKFDEELFIKFDCDHIICLKCYEKLLNYNRVLCPVCRKSIDVKNNSQTEINNRDIIRNHNYYYYLFIQLFCVLLRFIFIIVILVAIYSIYG